MKTGLNITEMAKELERRNNAKRDFVADTRNLEISLHAIELPRTASAEAKEKPLVRLEPVVTMNTPDSVLLMTEGAIFHEQVSSHYRVPREYSDRIRSAHPKLYRDTFNTFFQAESTKRMVRTLDGTARAFLSDRFRPLDNYDLANAVLPEIMKHKGVKIESTDITDRRFYVKAVVHSVQTEIRKGDVVAMGVMVSNSEVGAGSLQVNPFVDRLWCTNGAISTEYGQRRTHVGRRNAADDDAAYELYSDRTRALDDAAFFAKVRDTVAGVMTREILERCAKKMRDAAEQKIESKDLPAVVEVTAKKLGYSDATRNGILAHLISGGDLTRYGLMNAITRQSQDEASYDFATQMETDGFTLLELPMNDWEAIARAAVDPRGRVAA